jgi:hypothetical protein
LAVSLVAAMIVVTAVGYGVYRWLWTLPAPPKVELTEIHVPAPGDLLDWSPDGKRLLAANRRGEMWVVEAASKRVTPLPAFRPTLWGVMWGPDDRPLAFAFENPAVTRMWSLDGNQWKLLPHRGVTPLPSPDRTRVVYLTGRELVREYWDYPGRRVETRGVPPGRLVRVADLMTGETLRDIPLPEMDHPQVQWANDQVLIVRGQINRIPKAFQCPLASGKLTPAREPIWPPKEPLLRLEYVSTPVRDQDLRKRLTKLGVPALPQTDEHDWWLIVRDVQRGTVVDRFALGRRDPVQRSTGGTYHTWKCARPTPDQKRWAILSAYDTLHLLDLGEVGAKPKT